MFNQVGFINLELRFSHKIQIQIQNSKLWQFISYENNWLIQVGFLTWCSGFSTQNKISSVNRHLNVVEEFERLVILGAALSGALAPGKQVSGESRD